MLGIGSTRTCSYQTVFFHCPCTKLLAWPKIPLTLPYDPFLQIFLWQQDFQGSVSTESLDAFSCTCFILYGVIHDYMILEKNTDMAEVPLRYPSPCSFTSLSWKVAIVIRLQDSLAQLSHFVYIYVCMCFCSVI